MKAIFTHWLLVVWILAAAGPAMAGDGYQAPVLETKFNSQAVLVLFGGVVCLCLSLLRDPKRTTKTSD